MSRRYRNDWIQLIRSLSGKYGVDPRAALAVASAEGLGGGVGDQGTSFGPFQLHVGGALPQGRGRGWAESPAGIEYALSRIGGVARGLTGREAIESIVRRFERPADPGGEIARALASYSEFGGAGQPATASPLASAVAPGAAASAPDNTQLRSLLVRALQNRGERPDWYRLAAAAASGRRTTPLAGSTPKPPAQDTDTRSPIKGASGGGLAEAFYDPLGSYDNGRFGGAIGHHNDHVHLSITSPKSMLAAIKQAQNMGLRVGENPYVDRVDPVHVKGSFHYRDFPGSFGGRKLGEAIDVSGNPKAMAAYYRWATSRLR